MRIRLMPRRLFELGLLAAVAMLPAGAEGVNHSWDALVRSAKTGRKVEVTRMNSASVQGKLLLIDAQSITIQRADGKHAIGREDILRVRYERAGHPVLYGTLIGAAVGILSLCASERGDKAHQYDEAVGFGIILGAPAGALVGALLPRGATLYEAAAPAKPARVP